MLGIPKLWQIRNIVKEEIYRALKINDESDAEESRQEADQLRRDIADLEHKKSLEQREIEHLVKMKEEKIAIETEKKSLELQAQYDKKVMDLQTNYHEKIIKMLTDEHDKIQVIYKEIMARLPNVNMSITKDVSKS